MVVVVVVVMMMMMMMMMTACTRSSSLTVSTSPWATCPTYSDHSQWGWSS